ncbi:MAG: hypothetical protein HY868_14360 [Chloroflexi bacterium]|nr:hypothetical protein [Chloroflexota bacterium]
MEEMVAMPVIAPTMSVNEDYLAIANKVRADSQTHARPMHIEDLGALFPYRAPEQIVGTLGELIKLDEYADIKVIFSPSGAAFLYSENAFPMDVANEKIVREETQDQIASRVREDTRDAIRLTEVESLNALFPTMEPSRVRELAASMLGDPRYADIRQIVGPTGIPYLYSDRDMTENYATILARVEANDPYSLIVSTVRDESRIYPRPTKVALFYEHLFRIDAGQMQVIVESLLRREEYHDIKKVVASTGAVYLFSDKYMEPAFAEAWVQWEEVDRIKNP